MRRAGLFVGIIFRQRFPCVLLWLLCESLGFPSGVTERGAEMLKRSKAFGRRCVGKVGRFLRHPTVVGILVQVLSITLYLCLKSLAIALLSIAGYALPGG